ncbi:hypothetical protein B0T17DRAFT_529067 [Bombardia bombarda]|uniref:Uncharacterized protein n=1 Tax=Bombardia bombarda TaxID=252184 RepID=A0AA40CAX4_9PEZI|nr:hypothetical protein B0T17DRAFT_529067 [Bombardia bombarda]
MDAFLDLSSTNWSYYSIPVAFMLIMVPHSYASVAAGKSYDLANPRKTEEHLAKDTTVDKVKFKRIIRAKAAANNGFETIGLYAAAVVAANVAGVPVQSINQLALLHLATRAVYNYIYVVLQDNARVAPLRSLVWMASLGASFALFIKAGNAVN